MLQSRREPRPAGGVVFPFDRGGYRHVLLARAGAWAVIERTWIADGTPRLPHVELVQLRTVSARSWPDGRHTPAHEAYPPTTAWGREGWTVPTLVHARARWERQRTTHPDLPTWEAFGLVDDPEWYLAWKEGRLPCRVAPAPNRGIPRGHP